MAWIIRRRSITPVVIGVVVLVAALGAVTAATSASLHLLGSRLQRESAVLTVTPSRTVSPAGPGAISLQLAKQDVTPNAPLRFKATGFQSKEPLALTIADLQGRPYAHASLRADNDGGLRETSLALPARLGAGAYQLIVGGNTSRRIASASFLLYDIPPTVALDAYTATPGQVVNFSGTGFIPGEVVNVYLGPPSAPLFSAPVTAMGTVSGRLGIPKLPAGAYTLKLLGESSQTPATVGFSVQGFTPWIILDRYTLTPGERVGFIGHGFAPGEQVVVYLNSPHGLTEIGTPTLRVTADRAGQVVMQDTWSPGGAIGVNVLTFVGQWSKATTTAQFTVQATG